jgi:hypothetical protein
MDAQHLPIVDFGKKYIGRPITELLADTKYVEWIKLQPGFQQKHTQIYNMIVNQTLTPQTQNSKTPEHNKLQNRFLYKNNQKQLLSKLFNLNSVTDRLNALNADEEFNKCFGKVHIPEINHKLDNSKVIFEDKFNWDVVMYYTDHQQLEFVSDLENELVDKKKYREKYDLEQKEITQSCSVDIVGSDVRSFFGVTTTSKAAPLLNSKPYYSDEAKYDAKFNKHYIEYRTGYYRKMISKYIGTYIKIKINNTGDQYSICIYICDYQHSLCCEVKPTLGDDYTCVLRKLKEQIDRTNNDKSLIGCGFSSWEKVYVLIIGTFTSASATKEQLIKIFGQTGIKIVFTNEIFGQTKINMIQPVNIELEQANLWFLDTNELIEEIRLLKERNTHLEERNTHLEEEIRLLKERKKPGKLIKDYFEKK